MKKNISKFIDDYLEAINSQISKVNEKILNKALLIIENSIKNKKTLFVCGNGGSAAISNHYVCDYLKLIRTNTKFKPNN